jgi:hypothetical protein
MHDEALASRNTHVPPFENINHQEHQVHQEDHKSLGELGGSMSFAFREKTGRAPYLYVDNLLTARRGVTAPQPSAMRSLAPPRLERGAESGSLTSDSGAIAMTTLPTDRRTLLRLSVAGAAAMLAPATETRAQEPAPLPIDAPARPAADAQMWRTRTRPIRPRP